MWTQDYQTELVLDCAVHSEMSLISGIYILNVLAHSFGYLSSSEVSGQGKVQVCDKDPCMSEKVQDGCLIIYGWDRNDIVCCKLSKYSVATIEQTEGRLRLWGEPKSKPPPSSTISTCYVIRQNQRVQRKKGHLRKWKKLFSKLQSKNNQIKPTHVRISLKIRDSKLISSQIHRKLPLNLNINGVLKGSEDLLTPE